MKSIIKHISVLLLTVTALSCHRQKLEDPSLYYAYIPISTYWEESLIEEEDVNNISIYFYPSDGSDPITKISDNIYFNVVQIPTGSYSIAIFNEMVGNITGVSYQNANDYDNFTAMTIEDAAAAPKYYTASSDEIFITDHERVATWVLDEFVVDEDMVEYTRSESFEEYIYLALNSVKSRSSDELITSSAELLAAYSSTATTSVTKSIETLASVYLQPATTIINLNVRVENLNNASDVEFAFRGTGSGYHVVQDKNLSPDSKTNIYNYTITNRSYDNPTNGTDGYMSYTFNSFGRIESDEDYTIEFNIILNSGELQTFTRDVTDQMLLDDDHEIDLELTIGDDIIILPSDDSSAGFDVSGWGDAIVVPL